MLWIVSAILSTLWLLALMSHYTLGGLIHALLVLAVVAVFIRLIRDHELVLGTERSIEK